MLSVVTDDDARAEMRSSLDEIVLDGARRMLAAALEAEADDYIARLSGELDERGRRLVVRNGHAEPRMITTAAGRIEVTAPRINDKRVDEDGERCRFRSSILPPWARKSPKVAEVLPLMYLHGMSSGDFAPALAGFFEIRDAEDRDHAVKAIDAFAQDYRAKWPKAVAKIVEDAEPQLAFYDFPAEQWIHLKTTNPIESTFATVGLRTKVTKGPGSRAAGLAMAFKLIEAAETRWRALNGPHLVALVRAGARFENGVIVEREQQDQEAAA